MAFIGYKKATLLTQSGFFLIQLIALSAYSLLRISFPVNTSLFVVNL